MPNMLTVFADAVLLKLEHDLSSGQIASAINEKHGTQYTEHHINTFANRATIKRKNPYLCHELKERGFRAARVADLLQINAQTVYYHHRQYPKKPFFLADMFYGSGKLEDDWRAVYEKWREDMRFKSLFR